MKHGLKVEDVSFLYDDDNDNSLHDYRFIQLVKKLQEDSFMPVLEGVYMHKCIQINGRMKKQFMFFQVKHFY